MRLTVCNRIGRCPKWSMFNAVYRTPIRYRVPVGLLPILIGLVTWRVGRHAHDKAPFLECTIKYSLLGLLLIRIKDSLEWYGDIQQLARLPRHNVCRITSYEVLWTAAQVWLNPAQSVWNRRMTLKVTPGHRNCRDSIPLPIYSSNVSILYTVSEILPLLQCTWLRATP